MDRADLMEMEQNTLREEFKKNPGLFEKRSWVEDAAFLRDIGIIIPGKESLPLGYLKMRASDFIVEEIRSDGSVCTIEKPIDGQGDSGSLAGELGQTVHATLVKCNISTLEAVEEISKVLGCATDSIRYAGLKDKNAITSQAISIHGVAIEKVVALGSKHYFLKDIRHGKGAVEKGGLKGNRFTIFVRTQGKAPEADIQGTRERISKDGFINFYWCQRFGTPRIMNFRWGLRIAMGRYKEAVIGYLTDQSPRESGFMSKMRKEVMGMVPDWKAIKGLIGALPLAMMNENKIADWLIRKPDDYLGALRAVDDQVTLWVYGLSSLLFNESISAYIQTERDIPDQIPLLLSDRREDVDYYAGLLKSIGYYPPDFRNLKPFSKIRLAHRLVPGKSKTDMISARIEENGTVLRFNLDKGQYATALLANIFNIVSGEPPVRIDDARMDIIGGGKGKATLEHFVGIDLSKKEFNPAAEKETGVI